jgi:hypothetical protein
MGLVVTRTRMVTIVGPGGIGKSRLALAVAGVRERAVPGRHRMSIWRRSLTLTVLPTIAKSLASRSTHASVADRLAAARMLIVLDNMEQLADAAGDLSDLLAATNALLLLVTSRRLLNLRGERVYTVEPLAVSADGTVTAAVELFLDRLGASTPGISRAPLISPRSPNCPGGWMGCRWPLSWPRRGCGSCRRPGTVTDGTSAPGTLRSPTPARQRTLATSIRWPSVDRRRWTTRSHVIERPHGWRWDYRVALAGFVGSVRLTENGSPWEAR